MTKHFLEPRITESFVMSKQHLPLGKCPFCEGYGVPGIVLIGEDWGEGGYVNLWQVRCGECGARGAKCRTCEDVARNWNMAARK